MLQERDLDLLILVGLTGYASISQLAREFFPSEDRARHRIRALFDAGYLTKTTVTSTASDVVGLTTAGKRAVSELFPDIADRLRLAGAINSRGVPHHLGVVDARLFVAAWARSHGRALVQWAGSADRLVADLGLADLHLAPDGVAVIGCEDETDVVAVEVDTGTETSKVLVTKLGKYRAGMAVDAVQELWFIVTCGAKRCRSIRSLVMHAGLDGATRVLSIDEVRRRPVGGLPGPVGTASDPWADGPNTVDSPMEVHQSFQPVAAPTPAPDGTPDGTGHRRPNEGHAQCFNTRRKP